MEGYCVHSQFEFPPAYLHIFCDAEHQSLLKCCHTEKSTTDTSLKMATREEEVGVWSFGYGSNMDMVALQNKKGVRVVEHSPAILHNFRLTFNTRGLDYVEPGYAGLGREEGVGG